MTGSNPFSAAALDPETPCRGRGFLLDEIGSSLQGASPSCFEIIGETKTGKTSLLNHLLGRSFTVDYSLDHARYVPVYIDLTGYVGVSARAFWTQLLGKLRTEIEARSGAVPVAFPAQDETDFFRITAVFRDLRRLGFTVLLVFDEFQVLVHNRDLDVQFFISLRNLNQVEQVRYIVASRESMLDLLSHAEGGRTLEFSEFHNIFREEFLEPLSDADAREVVGAFLSESDVMFDEREVGAVVSLAAGFPHFLNLAGRELFDAHRRRAGDPLAAMAQRFERGAQTTLRHYWMHAGDEARQVLTAVAVVREKDGDRWFYARMLGDELSREAFDPRALDHLTLAGFLKRDAAGVLDISPPVYRKFVLQEAASEAQKMARGMGKDSSSSYHIWLSQFVRSSGARPQPLPAAAGPSSASEQTLSLVPPDSEIREKSRGRYDPVARLGEGSFGVVFRARDRQLDLDVAIKVIHHEHRRNQELMARFRREAKVMRTLTSCAEIVKLWDVADDMSYLVMELVEGRTLREVIKEKGRIAHAQALGIALKVLRALEAAHAIGVVHRDLAPNNIFVLSDGSIKVIDFGLAAWDASIKTQSGQILGNLAYMSSEQYFGWSRIDPRSDLFSLGIIIYEMLTGERPRRLDGAIPLDEKKVRDVLVPSLPPASVDEIVGILRAAVAKDPDQRIPSATVMRAKLEVVS
ncbi:MAG: protein kinase [Deltaproteobacteria bacterium]|nr:protein kinase [Deltaproteobacteria bacterium]